MWESYITVIFTLPEQKPISGMGSGRPNPDATTLDLPNRRGNIEIEERKGPGEGGGEKTWVQRPLNRHPKKIDEIITLT